jgi:predicted GH43/DUF377 family glycosyl hydrolase
MLQIMSDTTVSEEQMRAVYEEAKTPFKYGVILRGDEGTMVDCPSVFRHGDAWFMVYVCMNKVGYETHLARSADLLRWEPLGKILPFRDAGWDKWLAGGTIALQDFSWGGPATLNAFNGRYWLSYLGGALQGYETDPLSIGLASTKSPDKAEPWTRLAENPRLTPSQPDARAFESTTLYRSNIIWDRDERLGHPFVMFYNGKQVQNKRAVERIGMAVSEDMVHWTRHGDGPVIDNQTGISGDPQIVRMNDLWVMFYFGHVWKPKAFDTFACSRDLVNWTKWDGPHLVEPSEPFDSTFAHKPWMIKHDGVVYHFYCAVNKSERTIALATSRDLRGK